tara:strand:- start:597 stop:851 length:255 start_codon:yes stop_codon:yes gene_type:complete
MINHNYYFVCNKKGFVLSQGVYTKSREQIDILDFFMNKGYKVIFKQTEKPNFEKAYNILMDYFDELPDDIKEEVHQRLNDEANC